MSKIGTIRRPYTTAERKYICESTETIDEIAAHIGRTYFAVAMYIHWLRTHDYKVAPKDRKQHENQTKK